MRPQISRPRLAFWKSPGIYPILDLEYCEKYGKDPIAVTSLWNENRELVPFYQLRAKKADLKTIRELYEILIGTFPDFPLILNDYWKAALEWKAFGLHIGKEDYALLGESEKSILKESDLYLGTSCHVLEDISGLKPGDWDYTGLGPIFATGSKDTEDIPTGISILQDALRISDGLPITPIGGIGSKEIEEILSVSPFLFAMISGVADETRFKDCELAIRNGLKP